MDNALDQLKDIHNIHDISWWPLAVGWWVVIGVLLSAAALGIFLHIRKLKYRRSWKNSALHTLEQLENRIESDISNKEVVATISETLKRIALMEQPRSSCASLTGYDWLVWLQANDPKAFKWTSEADIMADAMYAPPGQAVDIEKAKKLIGAAKQWVR